MKIVSCCIKIDCTGAGGGKKSGGLAALGAVRGKGKGGGGGGFSPLLSISSGISGRGGGKGGENGVTIPSKDLLAYVYRLRKKKKVEEARDASNDLSHPFIFEEKFRRQRRRREKGGGRGDKSCLLTFGKSSSWFGNRRKRKEEGEGPR